MMNERFGQLGRGCRDRNGVVLLITLVILVILATLAYTLSAQVASRRGRDRYIINYAQAQYACTSGVKSALVMLNDLEVSLISRPNEPDFSDVFAMSEEAYQEMLAQAELELVTGSDERSPEAEDGNDLDDSNDLDGRRDDEETLETTGSVTIRGPYGPVWPLVTPPIEVEIGQAKVTIEVQDENAKYPLGWAFIDDEEVKPRADIGFVTFCEWMGYSENEIKSLSADLAAVAEIRPFKMEFKPLTEPIKRTRTSLRSRTRSRSSSRSSSGRSPARKTISAAEQATEQSATLAGVFHSSLLDRDLLARPTILSDSRNESALKYLGLWGTRKVNVNTAPRQVLEATLAFGSVADAPKIAGEIIAQRRIQPFSDLDDLKNRVSAYSDSIDDAKDYITAKSTCFTVKVTAVSGTARSVAVVGLTKDGTKVKRIAVISD